jgi:DNA repair protein RecO
MSHTQELEGLIIGRRETGESDLIIRLLSKELGKISILAKHARQSKRRFQGKLEVFDNVRILGKRWKDDLWVIEQGTLIKSFPALRENFDKLTVALAACEACDMITQNQQHEDGRVLKSQLELFLTHVSELPPDAEIQRACLKETYHFLQAILDYSGFLPPELAEEKASFNSLLKLVILIEEFCDRPFRLKAEIHRMALSLKKNQS